MDATRRPSWITDLESKSRTVGIAALARAGVCGLQQR